MVERSGTDPGLIGTLDRVVHRVTRWADEIAALVCAFLIATTTLAVIVYQQGITIVWLDDLLRMLLIWLVYLGSVSVCFNNDHITMDAVYVRFPPRVRRVVDFSVAVLGIALCGYITKVGLDSMLREIDYGMLLPSGYLPAWPQTLAIPLCFALMAVAYLSYLYAVVTNRRRGAADAAHGPADAPHVAADGL
jgi:TRAP-type C4-dicarboxylate transport system permease small subunit